MNSVELLIDAQLFCSMTSYIAQCNVIIVFFVGVTAEAAVTATESR